MATTLDELLSPEEPDDALTFLLTQLASEGFPTTAWESGGAIYTVLKSEALTLSDKAKLVRDIAAGGLLELSEKKWLTLLASNRFQCDRFAATFAAGTVTLTNAGTGAQAIPAAGSWITGATGRRYNSTNTGVVNIPGSGGTAVLTYRAESPGAAYNIATATAVTLVTPLPGVTAALTVTTGSTWLTTQGTDEEPDAALKTRCRARWATVGLQKTRDAYLYLAVTAPGVTTPVTRIYVDDANPRGAGTVDVWIAGAAGPLSTADESLVRAYVLARKSPASDVAVANAVTVTVNVTADLYYGAAFTGAPAQAQAAVTALINATPVGGTLYWSAIVEALMAPDGVFKTVLTAPGADLALAANQVAVPGSFTLNLFPVS